MPGDTEVVEALSRVQIALRASRVKDVSDLKFSMEIKEIRGPEHFQAVITSPGEIILTMLLMKSFSAASTTFIYFVELLFRSFCCPFYDGDEPQLREDHSVHQYDVCQIPFCEVSEGNYPSHSSSVTIFSNNLHNINLSGS